jgi:hypothetical protein
MLLKGKKSLKIPKELSESINRRRTDNTMDEKPPPKIRPTKHYTEN